MFLFYRKVAQAAEGGENVSRQGGSKVAKKVVKLEARKCED